MSAPVNSSAKSDPLAQLHKMSATAGAAVSQYVAINTLAIAALLLGIASILAILLSALLVLSAAGIILGLVALAQIKSSNGTQSGKLPAYLGLLLCAVMAGITSTELVVEKIHVKARTRQVVAALDQFSAAIAADDFAAAYKCFAPEFQDRIPFKQFEWKWKYLEQKDAYGKIHAFRWNQVTPRFSDDIKGQVPTAVLKARMDTDPPIASRFEIRFRERDGAWKIYDMPELFAEESH